MGEDRPILLPDRHDRSAGHLHSFRHPLEPHVAEPHRLRGQRGSIFAPDDELLIDSIARRRGFSVPGRAISSAAPPEDLPENASVCGLRPRRLVQEGGEIAADVD